MSDFIRVTVTEALTHRIDLSVEAVREHLREAKEYDPGDPELAELDPAVNAHLIHYVLTELDPDDQLITDELADGTVDEREIADAELHSAIGATPEHGSD